MTLTEDNPYTSAEFVATLKSKSYFSATQIVPIILEIIKPKTVVDVGCGIGSWLKVFSDLNNCSILGIDGNYVDREQLLIPPSSFFGTDLRDTLDVKTILQKNNSQKFDLLISLEVVEHLPKERGTSFVKDLTNLSDIILFSGAVPGMGGTEHINEQEIKYWVSLFEKFGYTPISCVRAYFKSSLKSRQDFSRIDCYAHNAVLYVKSERLSELNLSKELYLDDFEIWPMMEMRIKENQKWIKWDNFKEQHDLFFNNVFIKKIIQYYHRVF